MSDTETESTVAAPRVAPTVYSWRRHVVAADMAAIDTLSAGATAMDRWLSNHAWANPDCSLTVKMTVLIARCRLWGYTDAQAEAIWQELKASDRWVRSRDGKRLKAVWMEPLREPLVELSEVRSRAGKASGEARRAKSRTKTKNPRAKKARTEATETAANSTPDNDMNTCSPSVEQKEREKERERTTTTDPSGQSVVVVPPSSGDDGAPAPAACRAEGASGAGAVEAGMLPELGRVATAWLNTADREIAAVAPPPAWHSADIAAIVGTLTAGAPGIDVERALYRLCATLQAVPGDDGHEPLLHEVRALLAGAEGRAGLLDTGAAPQCVALALHALNALPDEQLTPIRLRTIAIGIWRELAKQPAGADPRRVAMLVAYEVHFGKRKGIYTLPCDGLRTPERLHGYATAGVR